MDKLQLLADLEAENVRFEELLAEIGPARMTEPGVAGHWSMKDIVAHLTSWRRRTVARLHAALRGEPEPTPFWPTHLHTDDEINAWMYETNRERPLEEVLEDSRRVFRQLADALAKFPESELNDPNRFHWLEGQPVSAVAVFAHLREEHEPGIRAWLARG